MPFYKQVLRREFMTDVKIFISYKDRHKILKSDILTPIQTGRAISDEIFEDMIGDDTGDNISKDNERYNELSAQYWVWKNYDKIGNPDYVGFMHYRRHFVFKSDLNYKDNEPWFPGMPIYKVNYFTKEFQENLSEENINNVVCDNYDCYVIKRYNIRYFGNNDMYMKEHYISTIQGAKRYIWDSFCNVILELHPEYSEILKEFSYGNSINACNMFIMKKSLFFEYSAFCFDVLKELDKRVDTSKFTKQEQRFLGYLAEYLLTMYVMKLQKERKRIKYLDALLFLNMQEDSRLKKLFSKILTVENQKYHKSYKILGIIKLRIRKKNSIYDHLQVQDYMLKVLTDKVTELQEQIILNNK